MLKIQVYSVADLLGMTFPESDSLLGSDLLDRSGAMLITGPQKIGKSLFASQLAFCLAGGQPFVGFKPTASSRKVLTLQAEVGEKRMQQRLALQAAVFDDEARKNVLNACTFSMLKLDQPEGVESLLAWVKEYAPDVVIVDPLANFHCGDENVAQDIIRVTSVLDRIRSLGPAVILVHHHGKASTERTNVGHKSRGSTALPGWYDTHLSLERAGETARLKFELRHGETPEDMILRLNPETLLFEAQLDEAAQVALVVSAIGDLGPSEAGAVGTYCRHTRQWAAQWLGRAAEQGKLQRNGNRPVIFSLPGQAQGATVTFDGDSVVISTNTGTRLVVDGEELTEGGGGVFLN